MRAIGAEIPGGAPPMKTAIRNFFFPWLARTRIPAGGEVVVKTQKPERARIEVFKTRAAGKVAEARKTFRVPRVVDYDADQGRIVFERIHGLIPFSRAIRMLDDPVELAVKAGKALAGIHRDLRLPDDLRQELPACWRDAQAPQVFVHGDFNLTNVCVAPATREIVVLDWAFTDVWGGVGTYGAACFDPLWFAQSLLYWNTCRVRRVSNAPAIVRTFLETYGQGMAAPDMESAKAIYGAYFVRGIRAVEENVRRRRGAWRSQIDRHRFAVLKEFFERLGGDPDRAGRG